MKRRGFLGLLGASAGAWCATTPDATSPRQRVVIIGGAWAGLSAARELRRLAPTLDVLVMDRTAQMRALPLSTPWLVDRTPQRLPPIDRAELAQRLGYRFVAADVTSIERAQRQVQTAQGIFPYDWLLLASGIDYDYRAWFGDDTAAARKTQAAFPAGFMADEMDTLKSGLVDYKGGDLVMNVPAPPYRCPPAPYERAMLLGWWLKTHGIKGRLVVLDATGGMPRFTRLFAERYPDQIEHRPYSVIRSIDPHARRLVTDDDELHFAHAMLVPPMGASALAEQAGLLGRDARGQPTRWAAADPLRLQALADDRIYLAGDLLDTVSPLFGHYPKTAHMAVRQGQLAAQQIAARSGQVAALPVTLPQSICHVWLDAEPLEQLRMEAQYRLRGDGVIAQAMTQHDNPQPRDEDLQWAQGLYADALGASAVP
jgi:NADPH-dependent 2,4-dienoyl-CoA reductase/sulfur reductase-like enzyme